MNVYNYSQQSSSQTGSGNAKNPLYPYLINFNSQSADLFWAPKPEWMSQKQWLDDKSNPAQLPPDAIRVLKMIDDITHKSGKPTYCRQTYFVKTTGKSMSTIRYWLRRFRHLGVITVKSIFHHQKVNSYQINPEFSYYKCAADRVLAPCKELDHTNCVRPQITNKCDNCHRFTGGLTINQEVEKRVEDIKKQYERRLEQLERREESFKEYKRRKQEKRQSKKASKAKRRELFLAKLQAQQVGVIETYEAVVARPFDVDTDMEAWGRLNKLTPINAITGILQTAVNAIAKISQGQRAKAPEVDKQKIRFAPIYSMKYFVPQCERVEYEARKSGVMLGDDLRANESLMRYLGSNLAELNLSLAKGVIDALKKMPLKHLGDISGLKSCLGVFAAKRTNIELLAGRLPQEHKNEATLQYLNTLLIEFNLRC
jgi:hypothetical protein